MVNMMLKFGIFESESNNILHLLFCVEVQIHKIKQFTNIFLRLFDLS